MSLSFYPDIVLEADQSPEFGDDIDEACEAIREAVKGWGTDEQALIDCMGTKSGEERYKIYLRYKELHDKDLDRVMKREEGGDFGMALQLLALPPDLMDAKLIKIALKGMGTHEKWLWSVVAGRSNADIGALKKAFFKAYDEDLVEQVNSDVGGDFERLMNYCLQGVEEEFDEEFHTEDKAKEDAEAFYEAGQGSWGSDEKGLFKILCFSPPQHLAAINDAYADKYGFTLAKAFEKELGGAAEKGAKFALGMKLEPHQTIAKLIHEAIGGIGTDELLLSSCLIRYRDVLPQVGEQYFELYEKGMKEDVEKEEGGDLGKLYTKMVEHLDGWQAPCGDL